MNILATQYATCANFSVNTFFPDVVSLIINIIKIGTPILLIILGMIDMFKAMTAQKEDEIKKAQGLFVKRLIAGILVYLVFVIVELLFGVLGSLTGDNDGNLWDCAVCFINGSDSESCKPITSEPISPLD